MRRIRVILCFFVLLIPALAPAQFELSKNEPPDKYTFATSTPYTPRFQRDPANAKLIVNPDFYCSACAEEGRIGAKKRDDMRNVLEMDVDVWEGSQQVKTRFGQFKLMEEKGEQILRFLFSESNAKDPVFIEDPLFRLFFDGPSLSWSAYPGPRRAEEMEELTDIFAEVPKNAAQLTSHQRAHLYLIRAHRVRRDIEGLMRVKPKNFHSTSWGPYMGTKQKYELYVFAGTRKPLEKYLKCFTKYPVESDGSWDCMPKDGSCVISCWVPDSNDFYLNNTFTHRLSHIMLKSFEGRNYDLPAWLNIGISHVMERRERTDFNTFILGIGMRPAMWRESNWKKATKQLIEGKRFPPFETFAKGTDANVIPPPLRGLAFAQVTYMLQTDMEKTAQFIWKLKRKEKGVDQMEWQEKALQSVWGVDYEGFEAAYTKWVKQNW